MSKSSETDKMRVEPQYGLLSEFLEDMPPNQIARIGDLAAGFATGIASGNPGWTSFIKTPEIQLHCANESCNGIRFFRCASQERKHLSATYYSFFNLTYQCSNCQQAEKHYSLAAKVDEGDRYTGEIGFVA